MLGEIVKFKSVKKIEKGFYLVKVQVNVKATPASSDVKKIDKNTTTTFAVYNNKIAATTDIFQQRQRLIKIYFSKQTDKGGT